MLCIIMCGVAAGGDLPAAVRSLSGEALGAHRHVCTSIGRLYSAHVVAVMCSAPLELMRDTHAGA